MSAGIQRPTFSCFVEIERDGVVPDARMLRVHPRFWLQPGPSVPLELFPRVGCRDRFLPGYPLAWVEHPPAAVLTPLWIPREWYPTLLLFAQRKALPPMDAPMTVALKDAGILIDPDDLEFRMAEGHSMMGGAHQQFRRAGYVNVSEVLHPHEVRALALYYCKLAAHSGRLGDEQCARRFGWRNESLSRFVHQQLHSVAEQIAGELLTLSYTYFAGYREGAVLDRHTDRVQCEVTLSVLLRYVPEHDGASAWPLCLATTEGEVAVHQCVGDVLAFRGRALPHWRSALPTGHCSDSLLLHYVTRDFTGPLQ